jgi:hypothetical protein
MYSPCLSSPPTDTNAPESAREVGPRYLLLKRGLYYRPDNCGYTGIKEYAGRYEESDASPEDGITAIHEDEAPEYTAACFEDLKLKHVSDKLAAANALIESQSAEIARKDELREIGIARYTVAETALTAAIEGQSYWQARAERAEKALEKIHAHVAHGFLGDWSIALKEIRKIATDTLADAQQTPKEMRDA